MLFVAVIKYSSKNTLRERGSLVHRWWLQSVTIEKWGEGFRRWLQSVTIEESGEGFLVHSGCSLSV